MNAARPYHVPAPLAPIEDEMKIQAFPNPADNTITIGKLDPKEEWQQCDIISSDGKILISNKITNGSPFITMSVIQLYKGLYFTVLKNRKGAKQVLRFIKQ